MSEAATASSNPSRLRIVGLIILGLYLLALILPLPELIGRTSSSSQTILGRYSTTYGIILFSYIGFTLLWIIMALGKIGVKFIASFVHRLLFHGGMIVLGMIIVAGYHLALALLFGVWNLSADTITSSLWTILLGMIAVFVVAKPTAQASLQENAPILLISVGFSLLALEVALRLVFPSGITQQNLIINYGQFANWQEFTGWAPRQNTAYYSSIPDEFTAYIETNSHAIRDRETTYEKPDDVYRILFVGDSMTFGAQVELEETYHEVFERLVNEASSQPIEVIGAGGQGWSNDQHLLYLRHVGCQYEPDEVILQMTINDSSGNHDAALPKPYFTLEDGELELNNFPYPSQNVEDFGFFALQPLLRISHTLRILWQGAQLIGLNYEDAARPEVTVDAGRWAEWETWRELDTALIAAIREEANACGAKFSAFVEPTIERYRPHVTPENLDIVTGIMNSYYAIYAELDIPHPSLTQMESAIVDYIGDDPENVWDLTWRHDGHYSKLGYQMIGEALANWYIEARLP